MKRLKPKHHRLGFLLVFGLAIGLLLSPLLFNWQERQRNLFVEISFVDPHQAVVFWKTDHESLGYIKYGETQNSRPNVIEQTSSKPGFIHTAVIDNIPSEGIYVSLHTKSDSFFLWPKPFQIRFDPSTFE